MASIDLLVDCSVLLDGGWLGSQEDKEETCVYCEEEDLQET